MTSYIFPLFIFKLLFFLIELFSLVNCSNQKFLTPEDMVIIPSGEFIMGSNKKDNGKSKRYYKKIPFFNNEHPERRVFLETYLIDKFEVTNLHYSKYVPEYNFPENKKNHPAVYVNWFEAKNYCNRKGKKLPTEAEWEKAARSSDGREYPWGNTFDPSKTNTGFLTGDTTPVNSYSNGKSSYGVYNMAGNVWEWTSDWYLPYPKSDYKSSKFGKKFKIIRGGARSTKGHYNLSYYFRSSHRFPVLPNKKTIDTGFRCVQNL